MEEKQISIHSMQLMFLNFSLSGQHENTDANIGALIVCDLLCVLRIFRWLYFA
jgi:hypothetical protein